ncbi:MAG: TrkA family potassium uptake protein [bacterium]
MYIVIIGGGKVGFHLSNMLAKDKNEVSLIEKNKTLASELAQELSGILVIQGDGCESQTLKDAGAERADVIVAATGSDEDNLVISQLAKEIFNIPRTVARVNDPKNEHIFNQLGVDISINSTSIIAKIIEEEASMDDFMDLLTFKKGNLSIVRVDLSEESPAKGKLIEGLSLPKNTAIVAILRKNEVISPNPKVVLESGDDVIAIGPIEKEEELLKALLGEVDLE